MNEDMPKASSKPLGVFVPSAGAALSQSDAFLPVLWSRGVTQNLIMLFPRSKRLFLQRKEELVMTQFMKLLLAGTITGVVMMTAAIGTAAAAGPENRITILYDAFGKDASMRKDWGFSALVEIAGKRILFDTGDDRDIFAAPYYPPVDVLRADEVIEWMAECPLLAQSGHLWLHRTCPLSGVQRTSLVVLHMSAFDPKRTLDLSICLLQAKA
jgi:hypothetical protein